MKIQPRHSWRAFALWLISGAVVTAVHASVLLAFLPDLDISAPEEPTGAIVIDFAETQTSIANQPAPGPEQIEAKANPDTTKEPEEEKVTEEKPVEEANKDSIPEVAPALKPEVPVEEKQTDKELPKPVEAPPQAAALMSSAPQALSEKIAAVAAAPQQGALSRNNSNSLPRWTSKISVLLELNKRYPKGAKERHEAGVVQVSFVIDRAGRLISSAIKQSSGHSILDEEAMAILGRSQPFPPVPPDVAGGTISITVPIRFDSN